jgi:tubulin polyglutamylase TTLL4
MKTAGFALVQSGGNGPLPWNMLWTTLIRPSKLKYLNKYQKLNHFAGAWSIGSKANLWRNVQKQRRKHGKDFEICPTTYIFPEDYKRWCNDREMNNYKDMYILKPTSSSCGRGIRVIGKKDQLNNKKGGYLVSKYLSKPHLLRGYKYDLRIYVVVTSFDPLKAYLF